MVQKSVAPHSINIGVSQNLNYLKATFLSYLVDPTLRMQVFSPPASISGSTGGANVVLTWPRSSDPSVQHYVYRSVNGMGGDFTLLNPDSPVGSKFFAVRSVSATEVYQVRAARLINTGGGSFTNLSQSVFWL